MNALAGTDAFLRVGVFGRKRYDSFQGDVMWRSMTLEALGKKKASVINAALRLLSKSYEGWNFELERSVVTRASTLLSLRSVSAALSCASPGSFREA